MKSILLSLITREQATDEGKKRDISAAFAWIEETFAEAKLHSHSKNKKQIALQISDKLAAIKILRKRRMKKYQTLRMFIGCMWLYNPCQFWHLLPITKI